MNNFKVEIASVYDKEHLVAEIWNDDTMIAEICKEKSDYILKIFAKNNYLRLNYKEFLSALYEAKEKLKI
jgi:hypothetical protein